MLRARPMPRIHVDLVLLFGGEVEAGDSKGIFEPLLVVGAKL